MWSKNMLFCFICKSNRILIVRLRSVQKRFRRRALFQISTFCAYTSHGRIFLYPIRRVLTQHLCIQSGWFVLYDIIQGTEEWKGAGTKFIQEVGTFCCIHFNIDAHLTPTTCATSGNNYTRVWLDLPAPSELCQLFCVFVAEVAVTLTQRLRGNDA